MISEQQFGPTQQQAGAAAVLHPLHSARAQGAPLPRQHSSTCLLLRLIARLLSLQGVFAAARAAAPAVVFIDEAEVLGAARASESQGGSSAAGAARARTLAALLTALDGLHTGAQRLQLGCMCKRKCA